MTPAQDDALKHVADVLGEHFDTFVVSVCATTEDDKGDYTTAIYGGGFAAGMGLLELAKMEIWNNRTVVDQKDD